MNVVEVNSNYKPEKELANVQDLIAKGVDAIAVITAGAAGSAKSVKRPTTGMCPSSLSRGNPTCPGGAFQGHVTDNFVIMGYKIGQWVAKNYPNAKTAEIPGFLGQGPAEGEMVGGSLPLTKRTWESHRAEERGLAADQGSADHRGSPDVREAL